MKFMVILAMLGCACTAPSELVAPEPVMDTEEVAAAKAAHAVAYDAAAAAAEAAPDFDLDGAVSRHTGYLTTVDGCLSPLYTNTYPLGAYGYASLTHPLTYAHSAFAPVSHVHAAVAPLTYAHAPVLLG